jgi:hypothetical protein
MALTERQFVILDLVEAERYEDALSAINALPENESDHGRMIFARGDCLYELGDDLKAMTQYLRYLEKFPQGRGRNHALMCVAVSLKNLQLQREARLVLAKIADDHSGRSEEIAHSDEILAKQEEALELVAGLGHDLHYNRD